LAHGIDDTDGFRRPFHSEFCSATTDPPIYIPLRPGLARPSHYLRLNSSGYSRFMGPLRGRRPPPRQPRFGLPYRFGAHWRAFTEARRGRWIPRPGLTCSQPAIYQISAVFFLRDWRRLPFGLGGGSPTPCTASSRLPTTLPHGQVFPLPGDVSRGFRTLPWIDVSPSNCGAPWANEIMTIRNAINRTIFSAIQRINLAGCALTADRTGTIPHR